MAASPVRVEWRAEPCYHPGGVGGTHDDGGAGATRLRTMRLPRACVKRPNRASRQGPHQHGITRRLAGSPDVVRVDVAGNPRRPGSR
jgi:hypothetical protein